MVSKNVGDGKLGSFQPNLHKHVCMSIVVFIYIKNWIIKLWVSGQAAGRSSKHPKLSLFRIILTPSMTVNKSSTRGLSITDWNISYKITQSYPRSARKL